MQPLTSYNIKLFETPFESVLTVKSMLAATALAFGILGAISVFRKKTAQVQSCIQQDELKVIKVDEDITHSAVTECALTSLGIKEEYSVKNLEGFYCLKRVREMVWPRQRIDANFVPDQIKMALDSDPRKPVSLFKEELTWLDPRLKTVAMPLDEGLMLMAAHYNIKYGITIVVAKDESNIRSALLGESLDKDCPLWGVIATCPHTSNPHVTPVICSRQQSGALQMFCLDSVLNPLEELLNAARSVMHEKQGSIWFNLCRPRQADSYSCRTDALAILKDALRDLAQRGVVDLISFMQKSDADRSRALRWGFNLPPEWGKTVQCSKVLQGADLKSSVISKKNVSLEEFQRLYKIDAHKKELYRINYYNKEGLIDAVCVTRETIVPINAYLNYKGKKNLNLVKQLLEDNNPEIFEQYHKLKSFYDNTC